MTIIFESLPYIDPNPTPQEQAAAKRLITAELAQSSDPTATLPPHPALRPLPEPSYPPLFASSYLQTPSGPDAERARPSAIDLSRYEAQEPLATDAAATQDSLHRTREALAKAHVARAYLAWREAELALLEAHGKNAWLVHNWQLEADLKTLEAELAGARAEVDRLTVERRRSQEDVAGEMRGLEEQWRRGVGRVLEAEVAVDGLRGEIRAAMRGKGGEE